MEWLYENGRALIGRWSPKGVLCEQAGQLYRRRENFTAAVLMCLLRMGWASLVFGTAVG